ncbi:MAG: sodium:proton antiporter [Candidatus Omnitrophica bacterium]|nr:sodium:proton antiporter [Candidatus Omnitrophota bacterium]
MCAAPYASALDAPADPILIAQDGGASETAPPPESEHAAQAHAEDAHGSHPSLGENLPLWSCIPFVGILLSIAFFPLFAPHFWHHHFPKISFLWALALAIPFLFVYKADAVYEILHIYILDYIPFIILLWSLYTISGGILLRGSLVGTPMLNTGMIFIGAFLASWMGTTGAAMLLIRPFLRANKHRKNRTFMVVFFIFLVANIGGSLTPLGDPPLFLGFLHGVPFFWTFKLLPHMLACSAVLLVLYFIVDWIMYQKEENRPVIEEKQPLRILGSYNFLFLAGVVGAVLMSGLADMGHLMVWKVHVTVQDLLRNVILVVLGIVSLKVTPRALRQENEFTWFPIAEVAYLFAGIFMTMIPCLAILKAGEHGAAASLVSAVNTPLHYFWITGLLSSFLDNAPTYLTFFTSVLGKFYPGMAEPEAVAALIKDHPIFLEAISAGAVFFGAMTYIGNAPNFMVRSIAEEAGIPMPSFFGYIFKYSLLILAPVFVLVTFIFFLV